VALDCEEEGDGRFPVSHEKAQRDGDLQDDGDIEADAVWVSA